MTDFFFLNLLRPHPRPLCYVLMISYSPRRRRLRRRDLSSLGLFVLRRSLRRELQRVQPRVELFLQDRVDRAMPRHRRHPFELLAHDRHVEVRLLAPHAGVAVVLPALVQRVLLAVVADEDVRRRERGDDLLLYRVSHGHPLARLGVDRAEWGGGETRTRRGALRRGGAGAARRRRGRGRERAGGEERGGHVRARAVRGALTARR
eukprot:30723-Pelagococcus_subviridis.AAC.19